MKTEKYTVYPDDSSYAVRGLTIIESMRHIYTYDGAQFKLEKGENKGGLQFWKVSFKEPEDQYYRKSFYCVVGETEEEAEEDFLLSAYREHIYGEEWSIMTDIEFDALQAECEQP